MHKVTVDIFVTDSVDEDSLFKDLRDLDISARSTGVPSGNSGTEYVLTGDKSNLSYWLSENQYDPDTYNLTLV